MTSYNFRWVDRAGFGLGLLGLALLAGCADSPPWGGIGQRPSATQIANVLGRQDNYVYFPGYEIYYNSSTRDYLYWNGQAWAAGIEPPRGIPVDMLLESPSVAMNFHDAPARHHAEVVRAYPRNWGRPESLMLSVR